MPTLALIRRVNPAWWGVGGLAAVTLAMTSTASSYNLYIFCTLLLAGLGAIALNVLMGTVGQPSIGNAAFLAVGSFGSMFFFRAGISFPWDVVLAGIGAGLVGLVVGIPAFRLHGLHLILATLAAHFIVLFVASEYERKTVGVNGFLITPAYQSKGVDVSVEYWAWTLYLVLAVLIVVASYLTRERSGRAWRMIRDHDLVAHTLGIQTMRYKLIAFGLSSAVIGVQGGLLTHLAGAADVTNFSLALAIQYVAMILIGGLDSIAGALIGAAIVIYLPVEVPHLVAPFLGDARAVSDGPGVSVIVYGVLIVVFIARSPEGVVGWLRALRGAVPIPTGWQRAAAVPLSPKPSVTDSGMEAVQGITSPET